MGFKDLYNFPLDFEPIYNHKMEEYVKSFQEKNNLNVDGVFGNKCWSILKSISKKDEIFLCLFLNYK